MNILSIVIVTIILACLAVHSFIQWNVHKKNENSLINELKNGILLLSIADPKVKSINIIENNEPLVDLSEQNRLMLLNAAIKAGLVNYGHEWWHYSFGDKAWAYVKKQQNALYGLQVEESDKSEFQTEEEYINEFHKRSHPQASRYSS